MQLFVKFYFWILWLLSSFYHRKHRLTQLLLFNVLVLVPTSLVRRHRCHCLVPSHLIQVIKGRNHNVPTYRVLCSVAFPVLTTAFLVVSDSVTCCEIAFASSVIKRKRQWHTRYDFRSVVFSVAVSTCSTSQPRS